jgi:hypothetical protein
VKSGRHAFRPGLAGFLGGLVEVLAWAAVTAGTWVTTLSPLTAPDVVVAFAAGAVCGVAAAAARRALGVRWRVRAASLRWVATLPIAVPTTTIAVLAATLRRHPQSGRLVDVALPEGEPAEVASSRRAIGALATSAAPASYVVDARPKDDAVLVHELVPPLPAATRVDLDRT